MLLTLANGVGVRALAGNAAARRRTVSAAAGDGHPAGAVSEAAWAMALETVSEAAWANPWEVAWSSPM